MAQIPKLQWHLPIPEKIVVLDTDEYVRDIRAYLNFSDGVTVTATVQQGLFATATIENGHLKINQSSEGVGIIKLRAHHAGRNETRNHACLDENRCGRDHGIWLASNAKSNNSYR